MCRVNVRVWQSVQGQKRTRVDFTLLIRQRMKDERVISGQKSEYSVSVSSGVSDVYEGMVEGDKRL